MVKAEFTVVAKADDTFVVLCQGSTGRDSAVIVWRGRSEGDASLICEALTNALES